MLETVGVTFNALREEPEWRGADRLVLCGFGLVRDGALPRRLKRV